MNKTNVKVIEVHSKSTYYRKIKKLESETGLRPGFFETFPRRAAEIGRFEPSEKPGVKVWVTYYEVVLV